MQKLTCEMCGSNDIIKENGLYVCQHCGIKYTPEEAKPLFISGTVKIDNTQEIENLYQLARRSIDEEDYKNAKKYYEKILMIQPDKWEPVYYCAFCEALACEADNIDQAAKLYKSKLQTVISLLDNDTDADHRQAIATITSDFFPDLYYNFTEKMSELGGKQNNLGIDGFNTFEYLSCGKDVYDIIAIIVQLLTRYENEDFLSSQKVFLKQLGVDVLFDTLEGASGSIREDIIKQINEDQIELATLDPEYKVRQIPLLKKPEIRLEDFSLESYQVVQDKENKKYIIKTASSEDYAISSECYKAVMKVYQDRKKSKTVAYILWFLLGYIGVHRFYVGDFIKGLLFLFTFGFLVLGWIIDVFFIGRRVDEYNEQQIRELLTAAIKTEIFTVTPAHTKSAISPLL